VNLFISKNLQEPSADHIGGQMKTLEEFMGTTLFPIFS